MVIGIQRPLQNERHRLTSRVLHLERQLAVLGFNDALRAYDLVIAEMNAEKGFKRHDGYHYYYHLIDVAQILLNFGIRNEDIITAALLHDFVEDVKWAKYEFVRSRFNERVADIVLLLTKKKGVDYKVDLDEMRRYLAGIVGCYEAALIKTADRIHNFSSMRNSSHTHRMKQVKETRDFYIPFFKDCRNKYVRYSNFFFFAKTTIEPILFEIEQGFSKIAELESENEQNLSKIEELERENERLKASYKAV